MQSFLNDAPIERLIAWCGKDQEKVTKLSELVYPFTAVKNVGVQLENSNKVKLSDHMLAILDAVDDKTKVVKTIFDRVRPTGWSGSLADILEVRAGALQELSKYPFPEVQLMVAEKLKEIQRAVLKERASEADENIRREQRFE